jgi:hypothetical protein
MALPVYLTGQEAHEAPTGNIIVFPYSSNVRLGESGIETYLSTMSTMSIEAGILLALRGSGKRLLLPGETPFEDLANTTDLMSAKATEAGIATEALVRLYRTAQGRPLNTTYLQSQCISERFCGTEENLENTLGLALGYHSTRAYDALGAFGKPPKYMVTVESVLQACGVHEYDRCLPAINGLKRSEVIARSMTLGLLGLSDGRIPNCLVKRKGARIVDVVRTANGWILETDFAYAKRSRLEKEATSTPVRSVSEAF